MPESRPPNWRPGGLTAISVIAIVLGSLGTLGALLGTANLAIGRQMQQAFSFAGGAGGNSPAMEIQRQLQEEINAVNQKYLAVQLAGFAGQLTISLLLLLGGAQTMRLLPSGQRWLSRTCAAAIVVDLMRGVLQVVVQLEIVSVIGRNVEILTSEGMGSGRSDAEVMALVLRFGMYVGVAFIVGMLALKLAYYFITISYLRKPAVAALFGKA